MKTETRRCDTLAVSINDSAMKVLIDEANHAENDNRLQLGLTKMKFDILMDQQK